MTKSILVSLAILTLSTSAALAAQHRTHHRQAMNANALPLRLRLLLRSAGWAV